MSWVDKNRLQAEDERQNMRFYETALNLVHWLESTYGNNISGDQNFEAFFYYMSSPPRGELFPLEMKLAPGREP
jgi:hypothetical protein